MIELTTNNTEEQVVVWLNRTGEHILERLREQMQIEMYAMDDTVKADKLSGQVLRNRTGTLRRATHANDVAAESTPDEIRGTVGVDPTAPYGKVHEYGGTVTVRAYLRRSTHSVGTWVREHTATYPERSFLRSTLRERTGTILGNLQAAAERAVVEMRQ